MVYRKRDSQQPDDEEVAGPEWTGTEEGGSTVNRGGIIVRGGNYGLSSAENYTIVGIGPNYIPTGPILLVPDSAQFPIWSRFLARARTIIQAIIEAESGVFDNVLTLKVPNLSTGITINYPAHASITLPQGYATGISNLRLYEDGNVIPAYYEVAQTWNDGTARILHICSLFKWTNGIPSNYTVVKSGSPVSYPSPSSITAIATLASSISNGQYLSILDDRGISWQPVYDSGVTVEALVNSGEHKVYKGTGWYQSSEKRVSPFAQWTIITEVTAGSDLVKVHWATTFKGKDVGVQNIQCQFPISGNSIITRNLIEKAPAAIANTGNMLTFWQWPGIKILSSSDDTSIENVAKFRSYIQSPDGILRSKLPSEYIATLQNVNNSGETTESKWEYANQSSLGGVSIHHEFGIIPSGSSGVFQQVFDNPPIITLSGSLISESLALGSILEADNVNWPTVEDVFKRGWLGYVKSPSERYNEIGWHIFGNTHHEEYMDENRASLHRVWNNNHYNTVGVGWQIFIHTLDTGVLKWARNTTDYLSSIILCRGDDYTGYWLGDLTHLSGAPNTKSHHSGVFFHCKGLTPWGVRNYGMDQEDADSGYFGHWVHADGLLDGWLIDRNWWAKDALDIWSANVVFPSNVGSSAREGNTTLVNAMKYYEYSKDSGLLPKIQNMISGLIVNSLSEQTPGPLWRPEWPLLSREFIQQYSGLLSDQTLLQRLDNFILYNATSGALSYNGIYSMALNAAAFDITQDITYLEKFLPAFSYVISQAVYDPNDIWQDYGFGTGPSKMDFHFSLQWPTFLSRLNESGVQGVIVQESGQYWNSVSRYDNEADINARGSKIAILGQPTGILMDVISLKGDMQTISARLLNPSSGIDWQSSILKAYSAPSTIPLINRASTLQAYRDLSGVNGSTSGLWTFIFASNEIGMFQGVAQPNNLPECQLLYNKDIAAAPSDEVFYKCKLGNGYLLKSVPGYTGDINLTFSNWATFNTKHLFWNRVYISGDNGFNKDIWLIGGATTGISLPSSGDIFYVNIYGIYDSIMFLQIEADIEQPLLFGTSGNVVTIRNYLNP